MMCDCCGRMVHNRCCYFRSSCCGCRKDSFAAQVQHRSSYHCEYVIIGIPYLTDCSSCQHYCNRHFISNEVLPLHVLLGWCGLLPINSIDARRQQVDHNPRSRLLNRLAPGSVPCCLCRQGRFLDSCDCDSGSD